MTKPLHSLPPALALCAMLLALSACGSPPPELMKPGATQEDFTKELAACKASSSSNVTACMKARGWVEYVKLER